MNKNQIQGRTSNAKGKTKEIIGEVIDDKELKYKGKAQKVRGQAESAFGDAKADYVKNKD